MILSLLKPTFLSVSAYFCVVLRNSIEFVEYLKRVDINILLFLYLREIQTKAKPEWKKASERNQFSNLEEDCKIAWTSDN